MKEKCPNCKKPTPYDEANPFRPFCSDRCRLIDLGEWADEKFRIQSDEPVDEEDLVKAQIEKIKSES